MGKLVKTSFPELSDDDASDAKNCPCGGTVQCVRCLAHDHDLARHLCSVCYIKMWREHKLDQYPMMRVSGAEIYQRYLAVKKEAPELTNAQVADRLGLKKEQVINACARQRRKLKLVRGEDGRYDDFG